MWLNYGIYLDPHNRQLIQTRVNAQSSMWRILKGRVRQEKVFIRQLTEHMERGSQGMIGGMLVSSVSLVIYF